MLPSHSSFSISVLIMEAFRCWKKKPFIDLRTANVIYKYDPAHEKRDLVVFRFVVSQMRMRCLLFGLQTCILLEAWSRSLLHVCERQRLWRDCVRSRQSPCWSPIWLPFSHVLAHIMLTLEILAVIDKRLWLIDIFVMSPLVQILCTSKNGSA